MRELTQGELRYMNESANGWRMNIYSKGESITPEISQRMSELAEAYIDAFYDFYEAALQKGEVSDSDVLQGEFDKVYEKEHPEFYDVDASPVSKYS